MNQTIIIPNRLNWIDWAKVIAITFVVFGHIPQEPGSFPQSYIVTFHMPLFIFIFGYLTKKKYLISITKCLPFFYLGYYCKQNRIISVKPQPKDWYVCIGCMCISLAGYMIQDYMSSIPLFAFRFWLVSITAIGGILSLCKLLDHIHSAIIDNLSIGTIVIMGVHFMMIGTTNFILENILHIEHRIIYSWFIAFVLAITFEMILYPIIILFKNKFPFMLGKSTHITENK